MSAPQTDMVYGLVSSDEPLQIRYVGRTRTPSLRLSQHRRRRGGYNTPLWQWADAVVRRGAQIEMRFLSGPHTRPEARAAERKWFDFWFNYCELLNCFPP
jgi:hypothetical protein